ncbi:MAG TPA: phosphoribosyltransferase family protein [Thermoanaerobaculia bacterium]|nr:phosphoribosyltransferase family protein [Thermoanaerobaculia bacterium]
MEQLKIQRRHDAASIAARVAEVAAKLDKEVAGQPLALLGVLKGSSFFLSDLARQMTSPVTCEFINVRRAEGSDEIVQIDFATGFTVRDRPVLLLKDVVSFGVIENYLIDHLRDDGAASVRLAAIVDKPHDRRAEIAVDHSLFHAEGGILVGYGMDYQGRFAQLPYIAEVFAEQ